MRVINQILIHCSATSEYMDIGVDEIRTWHKERGWSDVGYHFIIRRDGTPEKGRAVEIAGAHAKGYNAHSIAICLVGGVDKNQQPTDNFTDDQMETLDILLMSLIEMYDTVIDVRGHRDLPDVAKDCPCFSVEEELLSNPATYTHDTWQERMNKTKLH